MNRSKLFAEPSTRNRSILLLLGGVVAMAATIACSSGSKPSFDLSRPVIADVKPAVSKPAAPAVSQPIVAVARKNVPLPGKASSPKATGYKSRDYGVSVDYPWQYAVFGAKAIANDSSLQPKTDGDDNQFALVRVEIPKGFYPDSDFDRGYFTLSLDQDVDQQQCESSISAGTDGKVNTDTINGVPFRWSASDTGGGGSAARIRNYVSFANGTCYELEMGVKTKNERGLAREVRTDQVMERLNAILQTVKIQPERQKPLRQPRESSASLSPPAPQN